MLGFLVLILLFFFLKVLSLQASLLGVFFNRYGKGLCGGEGSGWPLISECLKLVKLVTGLQSFTMIASPLLLLWVSLP